MPPLPRPRGRARPWARANGLDRRGPRCATVFFDDQDSCAWLAQAMKGRRGPQFCLLRLGPLDDRRSPDLEGASTDRLGENLTLSYINTPGGSTDGSDRYTGPDRCPSPSLSIDTPGI